jgi:cytochrome c biogenesis protein CcmG/thiol:disulfide interchange protein DsbE
VAAVLVPLVAFTWLLASGLGKDPRALPSELIGRRAPAFSLERLGGGGPVSLVELRGQVVVLNYFASWCAECRIESPALQAAWQRYRERGVVFLGVDFEDSAGAAARYGAEQRIGWPLLLDPGSKAALDYGVYGVPETFVISPEGTILAKRIGPVGYAWLTDRIESAVRLPGGTAA